jgi:hypothetical protein
MKRFMTQALMFSSLAMLLGGCASWTSPSALDRPYFVTEPAELKVFQALARKQDGVVAKCAETSSCDHAYFTRALIGLYESREVAEKYFGKVLAIAPKGQLAASSKAWLDLLQVHPAPSALSWLDAVIGWPAILRANTSLGQTSDRLVRDLLDREVLLQQIRSTKDGDFQTVEALQRELAERDRRIEMLSKGQGRSDPPSVQTLQKQLAERDRKIEELSTQLEALKRIDQEMREKVRPIRPPSTVAPIPVPEPMP